MPSFICTACGTSYPPSEKPPADCPICEEERQLVPEAGQSWTTAQGLAARHLNAFREYEPGIIGIGSRPQFGIGQRACWSGVASRSSQRGLPVNSSPSHQTVPASIASRSVSDIGGRAFAAHPNRGFVIRFRRKVRRLIDFPRYVVENSVP
jgi:hypothetical protein